MIEQFRINADFEMVIFDQEFEPFQRLADIAKKDDTHALHHNYDEVDIKDFVFMNLLMYKQQPAIFYGLQQKDWMPKHAARAYTRLYKSPQFRDPSYHTIFNTELLWGVCDYNMYEHVWRSKDITTLFITRNVMAKRDPSATVFRRYFGGSESGWHKYSQVCTINSIPQRVMWMGDPDVEFLTPYHTMPE